MKKNKIFELSVATNLGSALTETMKSVSQHEGGIKHGEINLPKFKEEVIKTEEDAKIFVETMENIPEPNDKLKQAFKDFGKKETLEEADSAWSLSKAQKFALSKFKRRETPSKGIITWESVLKILRVGVLTGHKFGVKWQQEKCEKDLDAHLDVAKTLWLQVVKENKKMYSEEEVHNILNSYKSFSSSGMKIPYFEWFEQFKK